MRSRQLIDQIIQADKEIMPTYSVCIIHESHAVLFQDRAAGQVEGEPDSNCWNR
jgi:hypothetical protein